MAVIQTLEFYNIYGLQEFLDTVRQTKAVWTIAPEHHLFTYYAGKMIIAARFVIFNET